MQPFNWSFVTPKFKGPLEFNNMDHKDRRSHRKGHLPHSLYLYAWEQRYKNRVRERHKMTSEVWSLEKRNVGTEGRSATIKQLRPNYSAKILILKVLEVPNSLYIIYRSKISILSNNNLLVAMFTAIYSEQ